MSYSTKIDEISEKLNRLKNGGGVTRPLVPAYDTNSAAYIEQTKKYDQLLQLVLELKSDFNLFRREVALALKEIKEGAGSFSTGGLNTAENKSSGAGEESLDDILGQLSALKNQIKSALDFDKD